MRATGCWSSPEHTSRGANPGTGKMHVGTGRNPNRLSKGGVMTNVLYATSSTPTGRAAKRHGATWGKLLDMRCMRPPFLLLAVFWWTMPAAGPAPTPPVPEALSKEDQQI